MINGERVMWNCVRRSGRPDIHLRRRGSAPPASRSRGACPRCLAFLAASYPKAGPAHSTAALHVGRVTNEPTTFGQNEPKIFRMRAPKAEARHFIPAARPSPHCAKPASKDAWLPACVATAYWQNPGYGCSRTPNRPARSCTNCQATRPERAPRVVAHSSASRSSCSPPYGMPKWVT